MNLPNKLTVLRIILVPVCMILIMLPVPAAFPNLDVWQRIVCAALFLLISLTDMLDGMIARRKNLITNFGKFLDPLADKFLVIGTLLALFIKCRNLDPVFPVVLIFATTVIIMRELAVTSLRLLVAGSTGEVIAAKWLGKIKTVTQMVCIMTILLEPIVLGDFGKYNLLSYLTMILMTLMTVWSGYDYIKGYWKFLDSSV
ncbi:MAG: CDP-diacylglycerol--glycerol-3-phosphate 3-phosphatidyltransferase [Clostridia bacterium]|nr:CDP-diacylglycerol--glycerol-3-phosphate 3-phosphatidyltransferase [Clostridia bacterium]